MVATLSNVRTGEVIRLGSAEAASWAPVWSPDGRRVAFYSDEGGTAGLWIWDRSTGRSTRIPDVIVRPFFGFETVQWAADGRRLIVKALPAGITVAQANGLEEARPGQARRFPEAGPDEPSVSVRRFDSDGCPCGTGRFCAIA
jgi:dipeptidyl aminopeptidase/acylaminoacyl peptidase